MARKTKDKSQREIKSFETAQGDEFGDLLSASRIETHKKLKIGLLWTGFFEYWPMYPELKGQIARDGKVVYDRLRKKHDVVVTPMVDTIDAADAAGRLFRDKQVDLVILAYRAYVPDMYMHQMLSHLPADMPLLINAITLTTLFWEVAYAAIVWPRLTRPFAIGMGIAVHLGIGLAMGMMEFGLAMIVANLAFVPAATWRRWTGANAPATVEDD